MPACITSRSELAIAADLFAQSCKMSRDHVAAAQSALRQYGSHGALISGCVRDHFPAAVKDELRAMSRRVSELSDAAHKARPPRVRVSTMRALHRAISKRDGSGFYGHQCLAAAISLTVAA